MEKATHKIGFDTLIVKLAEAQAAVLEWGNESVATFPSPAKKKFLDAMKSAMNLSKELDK